MKQYCFIVTHWFLHVSDIAVFVSLVVGICRIAPKATGGALLSCESAEYK